MADSYVQVPADSSGKKIDAASLDVGANTVQRQRIILADNSATATYATILASTPGGTEGALVVRNIPSGTQTVSGGVAISGTALCSITSSIGFNVSGTVALAAGSANIGTINGISATVTVVNAAGSANIGSINNISATVTVAGTVNVNGGVAISGSVALAAGSANIGSINNISATVTVAFANIALTSVSHGPTCVTASTSAVVTLIASPGAGQSVYVTSLAVTNMGTVNTLTRVGTSASTGAVLMGAASAGGGFVMNFSPPWKLSASEACLCSVKPNTAGNAYFNVNFYVAP